MNFKQYLQKSEHVQYLNTKDQSTPKRNYQYHDEIQNAHKKTKCNVSLDHMELQRHENAEKLAWQGNVNLKKVQFC